MNQSRLLVIASLLIAVASFAALKAKDKIFIKSKNTKVLAKPDLKAAQVDTVQPGEQVVWQSKASDIFHEVVTPKGRKGFVYYANLSVKQPSPEYLRKDGDKPTDPTAFASSGAATKALAPGPIAYGEQKLGANGANAVAEVMAMEWIAKTVTNVDIQAFADKRGVVSPVMSDKR